MSAASKARRVDPQAEVVVLERGGAASFAACGIPYFVGGVVAEAEALLARRPEAFARAGIDLRLHTAAVALDPAARTVTVRGPAGEEDIGYDQLVLATGAVALRPPIAGLDAEGVFTVRHYDDGVALRAYVEQRRPRHATIVGAGYVGLEFAEALRAQGLAVTVVELAEQVFPGLDAELAQHVEEELLAHDVVVRTGEPLARIDHDEAGTVTGAATAAERWDTDLVVVGGGVRPASALARAAGIPVDEQGAVITDARMATPVPGVWAAGDVTGVRHRVTGRRAYIPLGPTANKQGRVAGENAAGGDATFKGVVGTSVAKIFDLAVARTGLSEADCRQEGLACVAARITAQDRAHFYPGAGDLSVTLLGEPGSGRLLGAQLVGAGAAKRIDVLATALHAGMTAHDVADLDLAYAPPYAPVWDPVLVAAGQLVKALGAAPPAAAATAAGAST